MVSGKMFLLAGIAMIFLFPLTSGQTNDGNCDKNFPQMCPSGTFCGAPRNSNDNIQYKCYYCSCVNATQCYFTNGITIACNCAGFGTTGANCETPIDECASNPCQHGGGCTDGINMYTCSCPPSWSGTNCEIGKPFVGFTAYLSYFTGPLPVDQPLVLDRTLLNEGNGYDTTTGIFTVPVSGYYSFTFSVETRTDWQSNIVVRLSVDGVNTLNVVTEPRHYGQNLSGSNAGVLRLNKGQRVWLEPYQEANQRIEGGDSWRFTTFSGALLQEI